MLKLIEDIGVVILSNGSKSSFGVYECQCGNHITIRHTIANKGTTQCKICGKAQALARIRKEQKEKILDKFREVHGDTYDYLQVEYTRNIDKVKIMCKKHGIFEQTPKMHKLGQGCPECAKEIRSIKLRKFNTHRPAILYFVYFKDLDLYKLGVTVNLKHRFRGEVHSHEILYSKEYSTEQEAYYMENLLLVENSMYKYVGPNVLHRKGNTELLSSNILTTLYSSVETIESTEGFKALSGSE